MWNGEFKETPVYAGELLRAGHRVRGPAIIEEQTTTVVIPQSCICEVDSWRNLIIRHAQFEGSVQ
jgi:N-methylhydantoinase A